MPETLRPYQVDDLAFLMRNDRCLLLHEPGCGKTPTVCVMQKYLYERKGIGTCWVMPKSLLAKNRMELIRFADFKPEDVVIVDGTPKQVAAQLATKARSYLMGFDRFKKVWQSLPAYVTALHVDEFHMGFGGHESARTKAMYAFMEHRGTHFVAMTGTLVNGKLESVYPAIQVIEPRYYGSFAAFRNFHCVEDLYGNTIGYRGHDKIKQILTTHGVRRTFEEVYGKEAKVIEHELVSMNDKQRKLYDTFKHDALLSLEKFFVDGTVPGVAFIRARQIMEHPNQFPDLTEPGKLIDICPGEQPAKLDRLEIHLEDHKNTGKPLVIFAALVPQQEAIYELCKKMGLNAALLNGAASSKIRTMADEYFRKGQLQVLVVSPAVAAVGFNWQHAGDHEVEHIIFASMDFMDTSFLQAYRRFIRNARKSPLRITVLEYEHSIDQHLFKIIERKSKDAVLIDDTRQIVSLSA